MIKLISFAVIIIVTISTPANSQNLEEWQVYPSFSTVNSISISHGVVYNATLGGIFVVEDGEAITRITTMDGLYRANPTAIMYDSFHDRLLAGYIDGTLDVIDVETKEIQQLEDINRVTRFNSKRVNSMSIYQDKLYVSTSFGIVIYNLETLLVENSYLKLGDFNIGTEIQEIDVVDNTIYAATIRGVAVGNLDSNLVESLNWQTYNEAHGLPAPIIDDIVYFDSKIYALSEGSVFDYEDTSWELSTDFNSSSYTTLALSEERDYLGVATNSAVTLLDTLGNTQIITPNLKSNILNLRHTDSQLFIGTISEGLVILDKPDGSQNMFLPSGPYLNFFSKIMIDQNVLIATSTAEFPQGDPFNPIRGYYIFDDNSWSNFNINTNSVLDEERIGAVYSLGQNESSYFFGSWGEGIVKHNKLDSAIAVYNQQNSDLSGLRSNPNYVVISGLESDSNENMWAISYDSEFPLNVQLDGSEDWIPFRGRSGSDVYYNLFIDSFDQKWVSLITSNNSGLGLLVMDNGDPEDSSDDRSVKLTSSQNSGNLPDQKINAMVEDKNGEIWVGTGRGIARFIFPELIIDGGPDERRAQWLINEDTTAASRFLLRDVNVTFIAVNDANQKWVGSVNQGIWLLNPEGSRVEQRFTTENSDLISNNIESIAINSETGEVFVATELGLVSFLDIPKAPVTKMNKLKVFPNPFEYSRHNQIVIEGLSDDTRIKVMGSDGIVLNELAARGGRVSWDGYDYNGNQLGSGVYFVIAFEENGKERGVGKVVIIR
ncbi:MAG: two-component regulator propeller domain-containing protein [Balneolaceae bacterium]